MELIPLSGQQQSGESNRAIQACNDWLRLGTGRTLPLLLQNYTEFYQGVPPTTSHATLKRWSTDFSWLDRARLYDAEWEACKNAEREASMQFGLALDYERVEKLKRLARFLESQIFEQGETGIYHNIWLPDVKQIGSGGDVERVDIERFNSPLIQQYRGVLEDIAKEAGGRVVRQEQEMSGELKVIVQYDDYNPKITPPA